jgi:hypothetical protein
MPFNTNITPGSSPLLWSNVSDAFTKINANFDSLVATIGTGSGLTPVDFNTLSTNVSPSITGTWDLGSYGYGWRDIYLTSTLFIGGAAISSDGSIVQLPAGSKVGDLLLDESYFKTIAVAGQSDIVADIGTDTLTLANGTGITVTTNATTDTLTITNAGVTGLVGTVGQIGVSAGTGNVTLTNLGVTSVTAGSGIAVSAGTGGVTISNAGIISIVTDPGSGISLDTSVANTVRITNSAPASSLLAFKTIAVSGQDSVVADSSADTLTLVAGTGISLTTNATADSITITNSSSSSSQLTNGSYVVALQAGGSIDIDNGFTINRSTELGIVAAVSIDTVVYTAVNNCSTIKATAQFIGLEDGGDGSNHVQSCDIIVIKRTGPTGTVLVDASVYGTIHSSASPLATFDARWNAISSRIEITAQPVSLTNTGRVKIFATEINPGA